MKLWIACSTLVVACSHPPAAAPVQTTAPAAAAAPVAPANRTAEPPTQDAPKEAAPAPAPPAAPPKTLAAVDVFGAKHVSSDELIATAGFVVGSPVDWGSPEFAAQL